MLSVTLRRGGIAIANGLLVLLASTSAWSAEESGEATADKFIRLIRSDGVITALETAIVRYAKPNAQPGSLQHVDLIGAIHVGDKDYYEALNKRFREYDVVLYELVTPDERTVPKPGQRSGSPVSAMQVGMKDLLGLQFQLDCIDYQRENMRRADLTIQEFSKSMTDRGESFMQIFFRILGQGIAMQSKDPARANDIRLLAALLAPDRSTQLKRVMAEEFERGLAVPSVFDGPDGSTIITVRNRRAVDLLGQEIRAGRKRVAIFYGAAHLPDMENQLRDRFGLLPSQTHWLTAWKIGSQAKPDTPGG